MSEAAMEEVDAGAAAQETLAAKVARVHHGLMSTQVRLVVVVEAGEPRISTATLKTWGVYKSCW